MKENIIKKNEKIRIITIFICCFIFSIPFDTFEVFNGISLVKIMALMVITVSLFYQKNNRFKLHKTIVLLLLLCVYIFLQLLYTNYFSPVLSSLITVIMYTLLILLLSQIDYSNKEKNSIIKSLGYMSLFCVFLTFIFGYNYEGRMTIRFFNMTYEDPNQFGGYLIPGIIYYLFQFLSYNKHKLFNLFVFLILLYFLLLTGSRGALLACIVGIISVFFLYNSKEKISKKTIKIVISFFLILLVFKLCINLLPAEMVSRLNLINAINSGGTGRSDIWKFYLHFFSESALFYKFFGNGYGAITLIYFKVAHNTWIELLISTGIIGLILFLFFILSIFMNFVKSNNRFMMCVCISMIGLSISLSLLGYKPIWIIALISIICGSTNQNTCN